MYDFFTIGLYYRFIFSWLLLSKSQFRRTYFINCNLDTCQVKFIFVWQIQFLFLSKIFFTRELSETKCHYLWQNLTSVSSLDMPILGLQPIGIASIFVGDIAVISHHLLYPITKLNFILHDLQINFRFVFFRRNRPKKYEILYWRKYKKMKRFWKKLQINFLPFGAALCVWFLRCC